MCPLLIIFFFTAFFFFAIYFPSCLLYILWLPQYKIYTWTWIAFMGWVWKQLRFVAVKSPHWFYWGCFLLEEEEEEEGGGRRRRRRGQPGWGSDPIWTDELREEATQRCGAEFCEEQKHPDELWSSTCLLCDGIRASHHTARLLFDCKYRLLCSFTLLTLALIRRVHSFVIFALCCVWYWKFNIV